VASTFLSGDDAQQLQRLPLLLGMPREPLQHGVNVVLALAADAVYADLPLRQRLQVSATPS
jgi:hypothetical protein